MENASGKFSTVAEYIALFPQSTQKLLKEVRKAIKEAAPQAEEMISYNMPGYKLDGMLVWFAGYKNHIGFYPKTAAINLLQKELSGYKTSKGAIQFPIDQPMPVELIKKIVSYRVKENTTLAKEKAVLKKAKPAKKKTAKKKIARNK